MSITAKRLTPKQMKLIKKYGRNKIDWNKVKKEKGALEGMNIDAEKLRKSAWKSGTSV